MATMSELGYRFQGFGLIPAENEHLKYQTYMQIRN